MPPFIEDITQKKARSYLRLGEWVEATRLVALTGEQGKLEMAAGFIKGDGNSIIRKAMEARWIGIQWFQKEWTLPTPWINDLLDRIKGTLQKNSSIKFANRNTRKL